MLENLNAQQISFFIILILAFGLLITEKLRNDLVSVLIVLSLFISGILSSEEALSGFSSEPAIVVVCIFVLSAAMHHTGLSDRIGHWIGKLAGESYSRAVTVIMLAVAFFSAFTHHVTTTAVMLPVTLDLSRERNIPASKLLMPLSFAASLGTTITIIGAPAFLIASTALRQAGRPGLGIFTIAPIGIALTIVGTLFVLLVGRFILPERQGVADTESHFRLDEYFTEYSVLEDSPFLGKTIAEVEEDDAYKFKVEGLIRAGRRMSPPSKDDVIAVDDVLLVQTTPEEIIAVHQDKNIELRPVGQFSNEETEKANESSGDDDEDNKFVQAIIAPGSELMRRTISEVDFKGRYGAIVVGLWRREGWQRDELAKIRLKPGDVLLLQADAAALARVKKDPAFLMMVPFQAEEQSRKKAPLVGIIMLATILLTAFNLLPLEMAALAGAAAVVLTGCIRARQAYRAIDSRIYVFIAGAIPLGMAMEKSGTSTMIAGWLQSAVGGWSPFWILLAIFAVVAILTQFMSDAATTAIFAPVAVALAQALGHQPEPYVVTVAMASVASFLTPIGHHGNLLIYGPGGYKFTDFVRVGTPLTILAAIVVAVMSQILWTN